MIGYGTKWRNVRLILTRELRDQLRDRRTLFMIFVLPVLLYPLMGMSIFQVAQFVQEKPSTIAVFGETTAIKGESDMSEVAVPPLFGSDGLDTALFDTPKEAGLLRLVPVESSAREVDALTTEAIRSVESGEADAALIVPPGLWERLTALQHQAGADQLGGREETLQGPVIVYTTAREKSQIAHARLTQALHRWQGAVGRSTVEAGGVPSWVVRPFEVVTRDTVDDTQFRGAALWSKMLPVLLIIWALTGAFYPAIDLCAGEKERGTLETLLCSPAERSEIVLGKMLTVMVFSILTSLLNVISIAVTGALVVAQLPQFGGPPPITAVLWLLVALGPVAALFSALSLTLAAFARSTKEGQYYLMPLLLLTMTLVVLPMAPSMHLTLGNSLIPISGLVLLLRSLLEGDYWLVLRYVPTVAIVTLGCCHLAVRGAIDLFNSESILFSAGDRFDLRLWLRHLLLERRPLPTFAMAICCGVVILLIKFVLGLVAGTPTTAADFVRMVVVQQLVMVALPALLFTIFLTNRRARTLRLGLSHGLAPPAAVALAFALHPLMHWLQRGVLSLYPLGAETAAVLSDLEGVVNAAPLTWILLAMAVLPALCEELAFRGFILSGFERPGRKWRAIVLSSLFFGFTHGILQQQLIASLVGVVIGYLVIQSGSIWPGVLFHATHNGLALLVSRLASPGPDGANDDLMRRLSETPWLSPAVGTSGTPGFLYHWAWVTLSALLAAALLWYFHRLGPSGDQEPASTDSSMTNLT